MQNVDLIKQKFETLCSFMDERMRRLWAAAEAQALGRGGITAVAAATGLSRTTITQGMREQQGRTEAERFPDQIRRPGGGRKAVTERDTTLLRDVEALVDPLTRGDPQSPLRWTCKSTAKLVAELKALGHEVGESTVRDLLKNELHYSLQANAKEREGSEHPDRNAQFEHINEMADAFLRAGDPVISVDTKKKEL